MFRSGKVYITNATLASVSSREEFNPTGYPISLKGRERQTFAYHKDRHCRFLLADYFEYLLQVGRISNMEAIGQYKEWFSRHEWMIAQHPSRFERNHLDTWGFEFEYSALELDNTGHTTLFNSYMPRLLKYGGKTLEEAFYLFGTDTLNHMQYEVLRLNAPRYARGRNDYQIEGMDDFLHSSASEFGEVHQLLHAYFSQSPDIVEPNSGKPFLVDALNLKPCRSCFSLQTVGRRRTVESFKEELSCGSITIKRNQTSGELYCLADDVKDVDLKWTESALTADRENIRITRVSNGKEEFNLAHLRNESDVILIRTF